MELAASTLVILIVSVVILSSATVLTYQVFCSAEEISQDVDRQSQQRIEQLLSGGGRVEIADNNKVARMEGSAICGRDQARTATITLGIKNVDRSESFKNYGIQVNREVPKYDGDPLEPYELRSPTGNQANGYYPGEIQYFASDSGEVTVDAGETHTMNILITIPANVEPEQHIYTVKVFEGDGPIGVQQAYLKLE